MKIYSWDSGYYPNIEEANSRQQKCYAEIVSNIEQGRYIDVEGNTAYLFYYIHTLKAGLRDALENCTLDQLEQRYRNFIALYAEHEPRVVLYLSSWLPILSYLQHKPADNIVTEIDHCFAFRIEHNLSYPIVPLMSLLMHCQQITMNTKVDPKYFLTLSPINPKSNLSNESKAHFNEILKHIKQILDADYERTGVNYLYKMHTFTNGRLEIAGESIIWLEDASSPAKPAISIVQAASCKTINLSGLLVPARQPTSPEQKKFILSLVKEAFRLSRQSAKHNLTTADLYAISDRLSQIVNQEHDDQQDLDQLMQDRLSQIDKSPYTEITPKVPMSKLIDEFFEIQSSKNDSPETSITKLLALMNKGYTCPAVYLELAKNYYKTKQPDKILAILLQGKKDYNYNFDDRIKNLLRRAKKTK